MALTKLNPFSTCQFRRAFTWAIIDLIILLIAYLAALSARAVASLVDFTHDPHFSLLIAAVTIAALYLSGAYRRIWEQTSGHEITILARASIAAAGILLLLDSILDPHPLPRSVILLANVLALTGFIAVRYRSRLISGLVWRWKAVWYSEFPLPATRVLIFGAGEIGQITAWRLKHRLSNATHRYIVVGFVDDDAHKKALYIEGCPVLGTRVDIPRLSQEHKIDLIVVAVHNISGPDFREVLAYCKRTDARINTVPELLAPICVRANPSVFHDIRAEDFLDRESLDHRHQVDVSILAGKVILVTGAAGSIGSELCRQLAACEPARLIVLDNNESGLYDLCLELRMQTQAQVVDVLADITVQKAVAEVIATHWPQIVFHAAAYKHVPLLERFPHEALRVNIGGTWNLARLAQRYGTERFVLISSDKAVNPSSVMGASKRICELMMQVLSQQAGNMTRFTTVRFGNVLGSRGSVVPVFDRQIDAGGPVTVTDKNMQRYFMTIPEAVNLVMQAACLTQGRDLFMLQMGEVVRVVDLAERMIRMRGLRPYKDVAISFTGIRPGEKLTEELSSASELPRPTGHPGIVELCETNGHLDSVSLMRWIESLSADELPRDADVLQQLLAAIAACQGAEESTWWQVA